MTTPIPTDDGEMPFYAAGQTTARAAVVVIQEAFGVTAHIERCCDRLADAGYYAVAPALFHRTSTDSFTYDDFETIYSITSFIPIVAFSCPANIINPCGPPG